MALAFAGVDGSLVDVPTPVRSESWKNIEAVLRPLLEELKDVRLACGCSLLETVPVFHSTDVYHKHGKRLKRLYAAVFGLLRVATEADTPKGPAKRRRLLPSDCAEGYCEPTGEPMHDIINMRKLVSPWANDATDFKFDYIDHINRLSLEDPPPVDAAGDPPPLSVGGAALLVRAVQESSQDFSAALDASDVGIVEELKEFLRHPEVRTSRVWPQHFGACPPRGTMARLARRVGVELHIQNRAYGWRSKHEFRQEVRLLRRWYRPGRKRTRRRLGMLRGENSGGSTRGRASVWTAKLAAHARRLTSKKRLRGLWKWRVIARAIREAGITMQSGTVPVERLWAQFKQAFPAEARTMRLPLWQLLASLCYLRFNYRHYNHGCLPALTEGDSLLAKRLDTLVTATRLFNADAGQETEAIRSLQAAFR